jgi:hypothetical protein
MPGTRPGMTAESQCKPQKDFRQITKGGFRSPFLCYLTGDRIRYCVRWK